MKHYESQKQGNELLASAAELHKDYTEAFDKLLKSDEMISGQEKMSKQKELLEELANIVMAHSMICSVIIRLYGSSVVSLIAYSDIADQLFQGRLQEPVVGYLINLLESSRAIHEKNIKKFSEL
jgi:hypothetical protein